MARIRQFVFSGLVAALLPLMLTAQTPARGDRYNAQIQQQVTKELQKHDWAKDVRASVEDGIVTLQGTVPLYLDKVRAYEKIHNKEHVQGVRNQIVVAGKTVPDELLRRELADKLRYSREGYGLVFNNLTLGVQNGVVTLAGEVKNPIDAEDAIAEVENTPGVKDVIDDIRVLPVSINDDQIRFAVARAVYSAPPLQKYAIDPGRPIRIVVEGGHVTLYGVVDNPMDKQVAEMQAKSVPNVFSVTNKLMVASQMVK